MFCVKVISSNFELFSKRFPTSLLSSYKIQTLCTSRFGKVYADTFWSTKILCLIFDDEICCTSRGECGGLIFFLSARISPVPVVCTRNPQVSASIIMAFLVDTVPIILASYVKKSIFEMRLRTFVSSEDANKVSNQTSCLLYSTSSSEAKTFAYV